jgi:hypothetical protein
MHRMRKRESAARTCEGPCNAAADTAGTAHIRDRLSGRALARPGCPNRQASTSPQRRDRSPANARALRPGQARPTNTAKRTAVNAAARREHNSATSVAPQRPLAFALRSERPSPAAPRRSCRGVGFADRRRRALVSCAPLAGRPTPRRGTDATWSSVAPEQRRRCATVSDSRPPIPSGSERSASGSSASISSENAH